MQTLLQGVIEGRLLFIFVVNCCRQRQTGREQTVRLECRFQLAPVLAGCSTSVPRQPAKAGTAPPARPQAPSVRAGRPCSDVPERPLSCSALNQPGCVRCQAGTTPHSREHKTATSGDEEQHRADQSGLNLRAEHRRQPRTSKGAVSAATAKPKRDASNRQDNALHQRQPHKLATR